jgi:hypothetical protein
VTIVEDYGDNLVVTMAKKRRSGSKTHKKSKGSKKGSKKSKRSKKSMTL